MKTSPRTPKTVKKWASYGQNGCFSHPECHFWSFYLIFFTDMECTSMEIHYIHHRALFLASPDQLQLQLGCIFCMVSDNQLWPVAVAVVENFLIWQPVAVAVGPDMAQQLDPTGPHISTKQGIVQISEAWGLNRQLCSVDGMCNRGKWCTHQNSGLGARANTSSDWGSEPQMRAFKFQCEALFIHLDSPNCNSTSTWNYQLDPR